MNSSQPSNFFEKIKANKIKYLIRLASAVIIIALSYTTHWNRPAQVSPVRNELPVLSQDSAALNIVTEPDQGVAPVLDLIKSSQKSLDLVMYQMTDKEISDALIDAEKRGVSVRVLLNLGYYGKKETTTNDLAYQYLQNGGVQVHWTPASYALTHQKTLVVDNSKALIMTWNFVPKYYPTGRDFGIIDTNQNDVNAIEKTFEADWNEDQITPLQGDDLVWSPGAENDLLLVIQNAKSNLDIYNEEMNSEKITDALKEAAARGVKTRVAMTYTTANKLIFKDLINSGIKIHTFSGKKNLYIHAKMILADESYAFVGSQNFSFTSLNKNRELGIFVNKQSIITSLKNTFETDWQNAKEFK